MDDINTRDRRFNTRIRTMQLIASALVIGVLFFLGVVLFLVQRSGHGLAWPPATPMVSYTALVVLAAVLAVWYFLPAQLAKQQVRKIAKGTWALATPRSGWTANPELPWTSFPTDTDKLLAVFQTTDLLGRALLEGAAFAGCTAYLLEAQPFALGVVGLTLLLMLVTFPTRGRISRWLEEQRGRVSDIRQSEGLPADPVDAEINQLKERIAELERQKQEREEESR